jgi:hypothetical protein
MAKKKKKIDWEKGEKLYRLRGLPAAEVGRILGCATSTVTRHMTSRGITQDLVEEVQQRTRTALATTLNATGVATQRNAPVDITENDIDDAVNANIALVISHRRDLAELQDVESSLMAELKDKPKKSYVGNYKGKIITKELDLTVTEKASTLSSLTTVMTKRIEKERQAFGIDDKTQTDKDPLSEILEEVAKNGKGLVQED